MIVRYIFIYLYETKPAIMMFILYTKDFDTDTVTKLGGECFA